MLAVMTASCDQLPGRHGDGVFAPGLAPRGAAEDQLIVGDRLMAAGQYELALDAYTRAAGERGLNSETLAALGSANLRLGRLNQAERQLRRAVEADDASPEAWNNLGVVLMESGQNGEAAQMFRRAFATSNGQSDAIRDNLRLALAKLADPGYTDVNENSDFRLVQRGTGDFLLTREDP
ncbi:tetratricopeptide repeat protein [Histidinibacterium lentulum]|uniref:Tetratricopeptide repeat protein n=2 Tax=Histidinibacterium lentulum TaxID=2480588 RepID=A0A3N2QV89_9RHOB|nr:tetratricopeptide repeat protein [Histidinibacterium lentulum]ROT99116.1 tetratricopeptide repeat protein [Histidinibacterium lentulum]